MKNLQDRNRLVIDFERICFLYRNIKYGIVGTATAIIFLCFALKQYTSPYALFLWVLAVTLAFIPRLLLIMEFSRKLKNQEIAPQNIKPWEYKMILYTSILYMTFVSVIFLPFGDNVLIGILYCTFMFTFLTTGAVVILSTSLPTILPFVTLFLFAIIIRLLLFQEVLFNILAFIVFLGYLQTLNVIYRQHKMIIENIGTKLKNNQFALIDPLTKLWNRRRLDLHVEKLVPATQRSGEPFSLIILDIDHFKQYNDTKGHAAGDELLIKVADVLLDCSREEDLVVRYGGEEFIVLLPQTRIKDAAVIAERVRKTVKEKTGVTISAGLAEYNVKINFDQLIQKADEALYTAKNSGRDQYVLAPT